MEGPGAANEVISLIVTYVGGFLLIFLVLYIVIPQLVETIPGHHQLGRSRLAQADCLFTVP